MDLTGPQAMWKQYLFNTDSTRVGFKVTPGACGSWLFHVSPAKNHNRGNMLHYRVGAFPGEMILGGAPMVSQSHATIGTVVDTVALPTTPAVDGFVDQPTGYSAHSGDAYLAEQAAATLLPMFIPNGTTLYYVTASAAVNFFGIIVVQDGTC